MKRSMALWAASVAFTAAVSAAITARAVAQVVVPPLGTAQPRLITGNDIGFMVEGQKQERRFDGRTGRPTTVDMVTGHLVVRVNGQWVEADVSGLMARPATN